jgi:hypothetical protein
MMNDADIVALMDAIGPVMRDFVEKSFTPLANRLIGLEKRFSERDGALADIRREIDEVGPRFERHVADAIGALPAQQILDFSALERGIDERFAALPVPQDGKSVTLEDIRPLVDDAVSGAMAVLPVPKDGKDVDPEGIKAMVDEAVAALPKAPELDREELAGLVSAEVERAVAALPKAEDGKSVDPEDLRPMIGEMVAAGFAGVPVPRDGKDADPEAVRALVAAAVAEMPKVPTAEEVAALIPSGKDADPEITAALVRTEVEKAVGALPPAAPGKDADPEVILAMVAEAVKNLPPPEPGRDATPEQIAAAVEKHLSANPPKDGTSVTIEDLRSVVVEVVDKAMAERPVPKDGVGLADALIDRKGDLVLTMTDGTLKSLGTIVGKDGDPGLGFDDLEVIEEGATFVLRLARGDKQKEWRLAKPTLADCYRGVWREGAFKKGDAVTWGGSLFIAQADTAAKPESNDDWKLAVKRGRDGKDGEAPKPPAKVKLT